MHRTLIFLHVISNPVDPPRELKSYIVCPFPFRNDAQLLLISSGMYPDYLNVIPRQFSGALRQGTRFYVEQLSLPPGQSCLRRQPTISSSRCLQASLQAYCFCHFEIHRQREEDLSLLLIWRSITPRILTSLFTNLFLIGW
jgi:hypothetical protein